MKIATFKNGKQDDRHFQNSMAIPPKYEYTTAVYMVQKSYYGISIQWEEKSVWEEV